MKTNNTFEKLDSILEELWLVVIEMNEEEKKYLFSNYPLLAEYFLNLEVIFME